MKRGLPVLVAASFCCAAAAPEAGLVARRDRLACGNSLVTAQASCHGATPACVRETLTFQRPEARTIVAPHTRLGDYPLADGRKVTALDYHASAWMCAEGANGGQYVLVVMTQTRGCSGCEFLRLYHPNGSLMASTLKFDAAGRPREDANAVEFIGTVIRKPEPGALRPVYGK